MTTCPHFENAPIVEAIFEIKAASSQQWEDEPFKAAANRVAKQEFTYSRTMMKQEVELTLDDDSATSTSSLHGVEYVSKESNAVVRIKKDSLSFHKLAPYSSFDEVLPQVQEFWNRFQEHMQPRAASAIVLRFVNRIDLPAETPYRDLGDYLTVVPHVGLPSGVEVEGLLSRVNVSDPKTGQSAQISFSNLDSGNDSLESVLLDITAQDACIASLENEGIWEAFQTLQDFKNRLFVESLTEKCLALFK